MILANERQEHENRVQILLSKLDQMKTETERIQSTTIAERQDLAKKLQDVFETALFKGSTNTNLPQNEIKKISIPPAPAVIPTSVQVKSQQPIDTQAKDMIHDHPTSISAIRSLSSRIDSLVDQTNRVANGFELSSRLPISIQPENTVEWIDQNQKSAFSFLLLSQFICFLSISVIYYLLNHKVHFITRSIVQHLSIPCKIGIHKQFLNRIQIIY